MAHEIEIRDGKAQMMYVGEVPWHKLGTKLDNVATAEQAIKAGGLDWQVEKRKVYTANADKTAMFRIPGKWATVRTDLPHGENVLGVVGESYIPIQNSKAFEVGDMLAGEGAAIYHTAGSLRGGKRTWVLMKLPGHIEVTSTDVAEKYLLFTTAHDGTEAARLLFTPVRVVCMNTLTAAIRTGGVQARVWHAGSITWQFKNALELLGLATEVFDETAVVYRSMAKTGIVRSEAADYFRVLMPDNPDAKKNNATRENRRAAMMHLFEHGAGADMPGTRGTVWQAYNAVTEWIDHSRHPKGTPERRLENSWLGSGKVIRDRAFVEARKLAAV